MADDIVASDLQQTFCSLVEEGDPAPSVDHCDRVDRLLQKRARGARSPVRQQYCAPPEAEQPLTLRNISIDEF
jgi:hypothetical protein